MLAKDEKNRLGSNGAKEIQQHPLFKKVDWDKLYNRRYRSSHKECVAPSKEQPTSTSNIAKLSIGDVNELSPEEDALFTDLYWTGPDTTVCLDSKGSRIKSLES